MRERGGGREHACACVRACTEDDHPPRTPNHTVRPATRYTNYNGCPETTLSTGRRFGDDSSPRRKISSGDVVCNRVLPVFIARPDFRMKPLEHEIQRLTGWYRDQFLLPNFTQRGNHKRLSSGRNRLRSVRAAEEDIRW